MRTLKSFMEYVGSNDTVISRKKLKELEWMSDFNGRESYVSFNANSFSIVKNEAAFEKQREVAITAMPELADAEYVLYRKYNGATIYAEPSDENIFGDIDPYKGLGKRTFD